MSVAYAVNLLETNLEWVRKQLKWLTAARHFKASKYFDDEFNKFKARENSLVGALSLLRKEKKRRNNHVSKEE